MTRALLARFRGAGYSMEMHSERYTDFFYQQPESIQKLIKELIAQLRPVRVTLFGSRARGDHRKNSDFDIACLFEKKDAAKWTNFFVRLQEEPLTLWPVDLVDFDELDEVYKRNIMHEGKILYERNA